MVTLQFGMAGAGYYNRQANDGAWRGLSGRGEGAAWWVEAGGGVACPWVGAGDGGVRTRHGLGSIGRGRAGERTARLWSVE